MRQKHQKPKPGGKDVSLMPKAKGGGKPKEIKPDNERHLEDFEYLFNATTGTAGRKGRE